MEPILNVNELTKKFGHLTAVNQLSFSIEKGNVYGMLGPNGSGKSTTLGMILNVVNPTGGNFSWFGGTQSTHQALKRVGAIIERPNFYPFMTAAQNLRLVCRIKEVPQLHLLPPSSLTLAPSNFIWQSKASLTSPIYGILTPISARGLRYS